MFSPYCMYSCGNFIPVFDNPDVYDGTILNGRPTFNTKTNDPTGKNPYFHTSKIGWSENLQTNVIFCHQQGYNGSQNYVYRDSTGRRQRY